MEQYCHFIAYFLPTIFLSLHAIDIFFPTPDDITHLHVNSSSLAILLLFLSFHIIKVDLFSRFH